MTRPLISFIIPSFRKSGMFNMAYPANMRHFFAADVEVVIVLDEPFEERWWLNWAKALPEVKTRIVVNDNDHDWRPPCKAINAGVRRCLGEYVAIVSPETIMDIPAGMLAALANYNSMLGGMLWNITGSRGYMQPWEIEGLKAHTAVIEPPSAYGYGFLMCSRMAFEAISGMDEGRTGYGKDDDDLRQRLIRYGLQFIIDPRIRLFHLHHENGVRSSENHRKVSRNVMLDHQPNWGNSEPWRISYDWATL